MTERYPEQRAVELAQGKQVCIETHQHQILVQVEANQTTQCVDFPHPKQQQVATHIVQALGITHLGQIDRKLLEHSLQRCQVPSVLEVLFGGKGTLNVLADLIEMRAADVLIARHLVRDLHLPRREISHDYCAAIQIVHLHWLRALFLARDAASHWIIIVS